MDTHHARMNPYDWINPVIDTKLFAGRKNEIGIIKEEIARLTDATPIPARVAIIGERRVGKTSLLRQIEKECHELSLAAVLTSVTDAIVADPWDFWHEIFSQLLIYARNVGILLHPDTSRHMGFSTPATEAECRAQPLALDDLWFPRAYFMHLNNSSSARLTNYILEHDLNTISDGLFNRDYKGVVIMLDEAHILIDARAIQQQIRHALQMAGRYGIVFAGESRLSRMFTDPSEPFYNQARVVTLKNFTTIDDVAECALLPLNDDERQLLNPMTVDYLARLSRGKPYIIRLICKGIYNRFINNDQNDLKISMDVLDDLLDIVIEAFQERELRNQVDTIRRLSSVDLELLYNMTRYPDWSVKDMIELDEAFRGESKSDLAIARRERNLTEKRAHFINIGLMDEDPDRCQCILSGGEFISLYIRFWYEIRKYGKLSRKLVLGKGPQTPFSEKTEKLARSLTHVLGENPEFKLYMFHPYYRDEGDIIETIKRRFSVLTKLVDGKIPDVEHELEAISDCFNVCELTSKPGSFYLLCLSVRNRENPRELMQIELYFDDNRIRSIDLVSLFNLVSKQAEDARVLVEGYDGFLVKLFDLEGLLKAIGIPSINELMKRLDLVEQWKVNSVQYMIRSQETQKEPEDIDDRAEDEKESSKWIGLYTKGDKKGAEEYLNNKLAEMQDRSMQARLYNDRGYIRCDPDLKMTPLARKDLETAFDLHFSQLPLTLLDLSCIDMEEDNYEPAIEKIEEALLLTFCIEEIEVSYLRYKLPENHLNFRVNWEQHPANVLEVSYINLAYAMLKLKGYQEAYDVLQEGMELIPSSVRLKHALARLYLFRKRADWASAIYEKLSKIPSLDGAIAMEVKVLSRGFKRTRR